MTGPRNDDEADLDFSAEELEALGTWSVAEPPPDLAARVLARRPTPSAGRPWRALTAAALAVVVAAAVAVVVAVATLWPRAEQGSAAATERRTVAIGERGVGVLEPGAQLEWSTSGAAAEVTQQRGAAFYRVASAPWYRSGEFTVNTPVGALTARGTCFSVSLEEPQMSPALRTAGAAVAGALIATAVLTVFEGHVEARTPNETRVVSPGERAELRPDGHINVVGAAEGGAGVDVLPSEPPAPVLAPAQAAAPIAPPHAAVPSAPTPQADPPPTCPPPPACAADPATQARVASLERALERERRASESVRTYDLSPETLASMADQCELRWDHPTIRADKETTFDDAALDEAGLTGDERQAAQRVVGEFNKRALAEVRRVYTEVTGDENADNLAPDGMMAEINDKTDKREIRQVFERLAAERAGRAAPPGDIPRDTPFEQLYQVLLSAGDALEAELANKVGPDKARALRDSHGGWGSKSRSSYGCPERTP